MGCTSSKVDAEFYADPRKDSIPKITNLPNINKEFQPLSTALTPKLSESYYIEQAHEYFNTLDTSVEKGKPNYSHRVARWEWPPWLILTAFGRDNIHTIDGLIRASGPCICVNRNIKFFTQNPFVRSVITFHYGDDDVENKTNPLRIYEEFTFSDFGDITFIEAWYGQPWLDLLPPLDSDGWPISQESVARLSTQIPGLGRHDGVIDFDSNDMIVASNNIQIVGSFRSRALQFHKALATTLAMQLIQNRLKERPDNVPL